MSRSTVSGVTGATSVDVTGSKITGLAGDRVPGFAGNKVKGKPGAAALLLTTLIGMAVASGLLGQVTVTPQSGAISISLEPTRTSGPTPLAVVFDATDTTAPGVPQVTAPWRQLYYQWDYGDTAAGTWPLTGASRNSDAGGPMGAHVFDTGSEGSKTVTLTVTLGFPWLTNHKWVSSGGSSDFVTHGGNTYRSTVTHTSSAATEPGVGANWTTVWVLHSIGLVQATATRGITVQNADTVYAGALTVCINGQPDGTSDGLGPAGCLYRQSFPTTQADNTRYLFRRGLTFTNFIVNRTRTGVTVGRYGSGAEPVFTSECRVCEDATPSGSNRAFPTNIIVMGGDYRADLRQLITCRNVLFYRPQFQAAPNGIDTGFKSSRSLSGVSPTPSHGYLAITNNGWSLSDLYYPDGMVMYEPILRGAWDGGINGNSATFIGGWGKRFAILGVDSQGTEYSSSNQRISGGHRGLMAHGKVAGPAGDGSTHLVKWHAGGNLDSQEYVYTDAPNQPQTELVFMQGMRFEHPPGDTIAWAVNFAPQSQTSSPGSSEQLTKVGVINCTWVPANMSTHLRMCLEDGFAYGNTRTDAGTLTTQFITSHSGNADPSVELGPYFGQGA